MDELEKRHDWRAYGNTPPEVWLFLQKQETFVKPLELMKRMEKVACYVSNYRTKF